MGQSPPSSEYNENGQGLPFFQGKAEFTDLFPEVRKWCTAPTKIAEANDILLSIRAPVGPTNLALSLCCIGRGLAAIRPVKDIQVRYVLYAIRTFNSYLTQLGTGSTFEAVSANDVRAFKIPLAPLAEQHRVVAAIEEQFTRLDAGVAALRRAQTKLKRYRAAALKAAVEGKLTGAWRAEHPATEPASILLERILKERRTRWEADLKAKGKDPAKVKYIEPAKPDTENLPELPEGWCWATVAQLAAAEPNAITDGPFGSNLKTEHYRSEGRRVIRLQNIGDGIFNDEKAFIDLEHFEELSKYRVFAGDLVIAALGENPPRSCIVPEFVGPAIVKADCIRFKVSPYVLNTLVNVALNAEPTRKRTFALIHGIGRPRLNLSEIKSIIIPLPPLSEQQCIMTEVEQRLSIIAQSEAAIEANLKRAERLRQSILKEAFAGRLIPQDPDDEPASVLLERIRKERDRRKKETASNGRYVHVPDEPVQKIHVEETQQAGLWESVGG
jgi:type I restriction enzyme S subunit